MEPKKKRKENPTRHIGTKHTHGQIKDQKNKSQKSTTYYLWIKNFREAKPNGIQNDMKVT